MVKRFFWGTRGTYNFPRTIGANFLRSASLVVQYGEMGNSSLISTGIDMLASGDRSIECSRHNTDYKGRINYECSNNACILDI